MEVLTPSLIRAEFWDHVILLTRRHNDYPYDAMLVYNDNNILEDNSIGGAVVAYGHWNDGVV